VGESIIKGATRTAGSDSRNGTFGRKKTQNGGKKEKSNKACSDKKRDPEKGKMDGVFVAVGGKSEQQAKRRAQKLNRLSGKRSGKRVLGRQKKSKVSEHLFGHKKEDGRASS